MAVERLGREGRILAVGREGAMELRRALAQQKVAKTAAQLTTVDPTSELARMEERIRMEEARAAGYLGSLVENRPAVSPRGAKHVQLVIDLEKPLGIAALLFHCSETLQ